MIIKRRSEKHNTQNERKIELVISPALYKTIKKRAMEEGISENAEVAKALRRGMYNYWLHVLKIEKERYRQVEKLYEQSKYDNAILETLIAQNERLYDFLEELNDKKG